MDQNPRKYDRFELYQGIANLAPNGPDDGGLCVLKGSHLFHKQHFISIGGFRPEQDTGEKENGYSFTVEDAAWYKDQGCEEIKITAGEGDLIIWDSRLIHWNSSPVGKQIRFATYVCYCPRSLASEEDLVRKLGVFKARKSTTHWPVSTLSSTGISVAVMGRLIQVSSNKMSSPQTVPTTSPRFPVDRTIHQILPTEPVRLLSQKRRRPFSGL